MSDDKKSDDKKSDDTKRGKVYIGSMIMRGKWAEVPDEIENYIKVNVTSAQRKNSLYRRDFSPMTLYPYRGYCCFENFWQSGKRYEGVDDEKVIAWWKKQEKGRRRCVIGKGKKITHAEWEDFDNIKLQYIESRKKIYVPLYEELVKTREMIIKLNNILDTGVSVIIFDFDGPFQNNKPIVEEVTLELLENKINDISSPFGHGYVISAILSGIDHLQYTL
tara:strand:+ start:4912 stop:5571 length:660 start_codon:yes stop_codon:yes gene_type:complete